MSQSTLYKVVFAPYYFAFGKSTLLMKIRDKPVGNRQAAR